MNRFLFKIFGFSIIPILSLFGVFLLEDGTSDSFYQRFATPSQNSLVLGSSRSAQGIIPSIINDALGLEESSAVFNYSFTVVHSPYGEIYSKSILEKLGKSPSGKGMFILSVDPWTISSAKMSPDDTDLFPEKNRFLNKLLWVNGNMNLQYLLNYYENSFYEILLRRVISSPTILHNDGWLEIDLDANKINYGKRLTEKIVDYKIFLDNSSFSNSRFQSFLNLVKELQKRGDVFFVRIPIDEEIVKIENELVPEFSCLISGISKDLSIPFMDLSHRSSEFKYTDGNHLERESAKKVSLEVADWIEGNTKIVNRNKNSH